MKLLRWMGVLLPGVFAAACVATEASSESKARGYELVVVREELTLRHLLSGSLAAERAAELVAPDVGIFPLQIRRLMENGAQVKPGDSLVEFDNSQLVGNLEQQEQAVEQAWTDLAGAESKASADEAQAYYEWQQKRAELEKARIEADVPDGLKSSQDYERLQLALRRAELELADREDNLEARRAAGRAQVQIQRLALAKAQEEIRQAQIGLERLTLRASRSGVVILGRNYQQGRPWQEGDSVNPGQRLARIPDLDTMIVRARLFDVDDGTITVGLAATVTLDAFPESPIGGRIRHIDRVALQAGRYSLSRVFGVIVDLEHVDRERMRPGMSAKVLIEQRITGEDGETPLLVPRASLRMNPPHPAQALLADGSWTEVVLGPCGPLRCVVVEGLEQHRRLGWVGLQETVEDRDPEPVQEAAR